MSWQKALLLFLQNRVEVLEYHSYTVRSPTTTFRLPAVMRLRKYIQPYFRVKDRPSRQQVFKRDQQTCQYCGQSLPMKDLTIDHVVPLCRGGTHTWENLVTSCSRCNNRKGSKTLDQAGMRLTRVPFKPDFLQERGIIPHSGQVPEPWRPYLPVHLVGSP